VRVAHLVTGIGDSGRRRRGSRGRGCRSGSGFLRAPFGLRSLRLRSALGLGGSLRLGVDLRMALLGLLGIGALPGKGRLVARGRLLAQGVRLFPGKLVAAGIRSCG
jgi:hypothetical protein